ncbi:acyltransferase family protein [Demequina oxidasica]|uniref:acyltransferase family protein n=1 Tax=Demequina oxidasica TaxID=676199 RepID=UPI000AB83DBE|nr:acyltransferase [Demequina oxidasica]
MSATTVSTVPDATPEGDARSSHRISGADGLRALAALWVVLSHVYQRLTIANLPDWLLDFKLVMMKGAFGVSIFFVLSGMLLSFPFWNAYLHGKPMPRLGHYARRRFARIAPGFYASLAVSFVVGLYLVPDTPYAIWRLISGFTFASGLSWITFFPVEVNGPLWSVGFEVVSYVLMPLAMVGMFVLGRRKGWRGKRIGIGYWLLILGVVIAVNQWLVTHLTTPDEYKGWDKGNIGGAAEWWPDYNPMALFAHFLIGIMVAALIVIWRQRYGMLRTWWWDLVALAGLAGAFWLVWVHREPPEPDHTTNFQGQPYLWPWFAVLIGIALIGLAQSRYLHRIVDNRFARFTAMVSFGIYIWHYLILHLVSYLTDGQFVYGGILNPVKHTWLAVAVVLMSYAVASASWFLLEKPILRSKWATKPEKPRG